MIPVEPQICFIPFAFENSYKSLFGWRGKALSPKTQVYVNLGGVAVRFDPGKVNNTTRKLGMKGKIANKIAKRVSLRRGMANVNRVIEYNARLARRDIAEVHSEIIQLVGAFLDEENPSPLTIGLIERINTAIYKIFHISNQEII